MISRLDPDGNWGGFIFYLCFGASISFSASGRGYSQVVEDAIAFDCHAEGVPRSHSTAMVLARGKAGSNPDL